MVNKRVRESDLEEVFFLTPLSGNLLKTFMCLKDTLINKFMIILPFRVISILWPATKASLDLTTKPASLPS